MATKDQLHLPSPPTFSQMMEDLELITSDDKFSSLIPGETGQTHQLINDYLSDFERLQRLDTSLTSQNDSAQDDLQRKLENIIEQLQTCLNKLQTKSFLHDKK